MVDYAIAIAGLSCLCVGWWLFQRLIARLDPSQPAYKASCSGSGSCGSCGGDGGCSSSGGAPPAEERKELNVLHHDHPHD